MSHEYVYNIKSISSKMAEIWHKTCQKTGTFHLISGLVVIFRIWFFDRFWRLKTCFRGFFAFVAKVWPKNMYRSSNFFVWPGVYLVTWDDLDLYYGHKAQEMIQMSVTLSMPIHWLCLRLTSKFYSPMSPSQKSRKKITLTRPVTSSVTSRSNFLPCAGSSPTGLSNGGRRTCC